MRRETCEWRERDEKSERQTCEKRDEDEKSENETNDFFCGLNVFFKLKSPVRFFMYFESIYDLHL